MHSSKLARGQAIGMRDCLAQRDNRRKHVRRSTLSSKVLQQNFCLNVATTAKVRSCTLIGTGKMKLDGQALIGLIGKGERTVRLLIGRPTCFCFEFPAGQLPFKARATPATKTVLLVSPSCVHLTAECCAKSLLSRHGLCGKTGGMGGGRGAVCWRH